MNLRILIFVVLGLLCASCSSAPSPATKDESLVTQSWREEVDLPDELVDIVLDEDVALAVKFRPADLSKLESFAGALGEGVPLPGGDGAALVRSLSDELLSDVLREGLDRSRSLYVLATTHVSPELEACLVSGLPCTRDAYSSPMFVRFLLPTTNTEKLEAGLREGFAEHSVVREQSGYLIVDYAYNAPVDDPRVQKLLEARAQRKATEQMRVTPTLARFLQHEGVAAAYGRYEKLARLASLISLEDAEVATQQVWRPAPDGMLMAMRTNGPQIYYDAEAAQLDDAGVFARVDDNGALRIDASMTTTELGKEIAEGARVHTSSAALAEVDPIAEFAFAANLARMWELSRLPKWSSFPAPDFSAYVTHGTAFGAVSAFAVPTFALAGVLPGSLDHAYGLVLRGRMGFVLPEKDAGESAPRTQENLRAMASMLIDSTRAEPSDVDGLVRRLSGLELLEVAGPFGVAEGRQELRFSFGESDADGFVLAQEPPEHASVSAMIGSDGAEFTYGMQEALANKLAMNWPLWLHELRWAVAADLQWREQALVLSTYLGPYPAPELAASELPTVAGFAIRQPEPSCFDGMLRLAARGLPGSDVKYRDYAKYLATIQPEWMRLADKCAESSETSDLARRAQAQFFWVRGQLAAHAGDIGQMQAHLEEACNRGMAQACEEHEESKKAYKANAAGELPTGVLGRGTIRRVIKEQRAPIQKCYQDVLDESPEPFEGRIKVKITIGQDGEVTAATVSSSTIDAPEMQECVLSAIRAWRFPKPSGGALIINYPFNFSTE